MRGFTSPAQAQRFLHVHGVIQNLFRVGRHLLRSVHHRMLRARSFTVWAGLVRIRAVWFRWRQDPFYFFLELPHAFKRPSLPLFLVGDSKS